MISPLFPHSYEQVLELLQNRLSEPPGLIQLLAGPRQVGKTTLLLELARRFGDRCLFAAADTPESSVPGWWENLWQRAAGIGGSAIVLIDEIQYLPNWGRYLKSQFDKLRRDKALVHIVVTGSSALHMSAGAKETLAGRFEHHALLHWSARDLRTHFGYPAEKAVDIGVRFGTYPGALAFLDDFPRWRNYVVQSIVEPAIGRDLLALESVRKPALLRQVFALATGHPAEILALHKICGSLMESGAVETVAHYLGLLEEAFLVKPVHKYSPKLIRRRSSPPKLVTLNQSLLTAHASATPPIQSENPGVYGRWVENACIAHACNAGQEVYYWRAEPLEVDMVISGSWGKWAVEIKTGPYSLADLRGLLAFCRDNPTFGPLVLCDQAHIKLAADAGVRAIPWRTYLLDGIV